MCLARKMTNTFLSCIKICFHKLKVYCLVILRLSKCLLITCLWIFWIIYKEKNHIIHNCSGFETCPQFFVTTLPSWTRMTWYLALMNRMWCRWCVTSKERWHRQCSSRLDSKDAHSCNSGATGEEVQVTWRCHVQVLQLTVYHWVRVQATQPGHHLSYAAWEMVSKTRLRPVSLPIPDVASDC